MAKLGGGEIEVPAGWTALSDYDLIKELEVKNAPLAVNRAVAPPRLQVSLLNAPPKEGDGTEAALLAIYEAMRARSPNVRLKERGAFAFADGVAGSKVVLEVEPLPGFRSTQVFVARRDGDRPSHLLANVPATAPAQALAEVVAVLKSFRPAQ